VTQHDSVVLDVDLVMESFLRAPPSFVAPLLRDPLLLADWFPGVRLTVFMDRGAEGTRWSMAGSLSGSLEVWLEEFSGGCIVHWYVRGTFTAAHGLRAPRGAPTRSGGAAGRATPRPTRYQRRLAEELPTRLARRMHRFKDEVEALAAPSEARLDANDEARSREHP
jgi:hypothetical protein